MTTEKIKQTVIWYLENYWNVIATIANFRNDVLYTGTLKELDVPVQTNTISNQTFARAVKLIDKDIDEMIDWVKVINETYYYYQGNDIRKASLIYYTYIQKNPKIKTKKEVIEKIFANNKTYYNWIDDVCKVAGFKAASKRLIEI